MLRKTLLLHVLMVTYLISTAQLKWLNPTPSGFTNTKLQFINKDTGYLFNENGDLFRTRDKGVSWNIFKNFPLSTTFKINDSTGIVVSSDQSIYISMDNGDTWTKKMINLGPLSPWTEIVGRDTIYLIKDAQTGTIKHLIRSTDRGTTWQTMSTAVSAMNLNTIDFVDGKTGYAAQVNGIFNTVDSGKTWSWILQTNTSTNVMTMKFFSANYGLAFMRATGIMKTLDGGATWSTFSQTDQIFDIFFVDSLNVYAAGMDGVVYKSIDAGSSWNFVSSTGRILDYDIKSQYFFNDSTGIITGARGRLLTTNNGGVSWADQSPTYTDITSLSFADSRAGYATDWTNVYKTSDGGVNWTKLGIVRDGLYRRFDKSYFWSADSGIVTSTKPAVIQKTTDGGNTWTTIDPSPGRSFETVSDLQFIDRDTAYVMLNMSPSASVLYKTDDAGNSWYKVGGDAQVDKIQFFTSKFGYGMGIDKFQKTSDGGLSWADIPIPAYYGLKSFHFTTPAKGFIAAESSYLQMTVDSGKTWTHVKLPAGYHGDYVNIRFVNEQIGFLTDDDGEVFKTIDGGFNWRHHANTGNHQSTVIHFRNDSTVLFAGKYGTIVTNGISEYSIDSIKSFPTLCGAIFKANISSALTKVDSLFFEYGESGYNQKIAISPVAIENDSKQITTTITGLKGLSTYSMRLKAMISGEYKYFGTTQFTTTKPSTPIITVNGNVLQSSATSGNQWFLNNDTIRGATAQQYTLTGPGSYTVIVTDSACSSSPSAAYNHTSTAVTEINIGNQSIKFYPNPVTDGNLNINIRDYNPVLLKMVDIRGRSILSRTLKTGTNNIPVAHFASGIYILNFTDTRTGKSVSTQILLSSRLR